MTGVVYLSDSQECSWEGERESCREGGAWKLVKMPSIEFVGLR